MVGASPLCTQQIDFVFKIQPFRKGGRARTNQQIIADNSGVRFGERTEVIGQAEAEIWVGDVDLCAHGVWDGGCASLKNRSNMY